MASSGVQRGTLDEATFTSSHLSSHPYYHSATPKVHPNPQHFTSFHYTPFHLISFHHLTSSHNHSINISPHYHPSIGSHHLLTHPGDGKGGEKGPGGLKTSGTIGDVTTCAERHNNNQKNKLKKHSNM